MRAGAPLVLLALVAVATACERPPPKDPTAVAADPVLAHDLVGVTPGEWTTEDWLNSPPLALEELRGRVVLVRWFMSTECALCTGTAPALRALHSDYAPRGLVVVGLYHHRGARPLESGEYEGYVRKYGFTFPVAVDVNWSTLERWWLRGHQRSFTSVSILLDREGKVRGVHPGGRFSESEASYVAIRRGIERLLDE